MTEDTYSFDEACKLAQSEAKRIVQMDRSCVRYVKHDPNFFRDYCRVDIVFDASGRGRMVLIMLPLTEREADEQFTDDHIASVARAGHLLDAIRLHRLLHSSDLLTAKKAVELMCKAAT